MYINT